MSESSTGNEPRLRRSPELLSCSRSHLLIVDVQEKLIPVIHNSESIVTGCVYLMQVAEAIDVPVFVSEQYPKGLGLSVNAIRQHVADDNVAEKLRFSASEVFLNSCTDQSVESESLAEKRDQVVIAGIEAHICVLQTAFDLLAQGLRVFVVEDAVGSRNKSDLATALRRIRDAGGVVLTAESVAFEWCEVAGSEAFKKISRLTRDRDVARVQ